MKEKVVTEFTNGRDDRAKFVVNSWIRNLDRTGISSSRKARLAQNVNQGRDERMKSLVNSCVRDLDGAVLSSGRKVSLNRNGYQGYLYSVLF